MSVVPLQLPVLPSAVLFFLYSLDLHVVLSLLLEKVFLGPRSDLLYDNGGGGIVVVTHSSSESPRFAVVPKP